MSKKSGIELNLRYDTWACMAPKKTPIEPNNSKALAPILKSHIRKVILNGDVDAYSREPMAFARAPFMNIDTIGQTPSVKVELNDKRVKSHSTADGLEITYNGPIDVTVCWRAKRSW